MRERDMYTALLQSNLFCIKIELAPGGTVGAPDVVCIDSGRVAFIECKLKGSDLSLSQVLLAKKIVSSGGIYFVLLGDEEGYTLKSAAIRSKELTLTTVSRFESSRLVEMIREAMAKKCLS